MILSDIENNIYFNKNLIDGLVIPNKINNEFDIKERHLYGWARFDNGNFNSIYFFADTEYGGYYHQAMIKYDYSDGMYLFNSVYNKPSKQTINEDRYDENMDLVCLNIHNPFLHEPFYIFFDLPPLKNHTTL